MMIDEEEKLLIMLRDVQAQINELRIRVVEIEKQLQRMR